MATRSPEGATDTSGFTEDQRNELKALINEAVGQGTAPPKDAQPRSMPKVSDDEWAAMSDRARQSWISQMVDFRLDELARLDADADRDRKLADLEGKLSKPEPEKAPSVWTKLQGFLWGEQDAR